MGTALSYAAAASALVAPGAGCRSNAAGAGCWLHLDTLSPHDAGIVKALCLYLNSTPGLLALLGERDNREPSYPSFSLDSLRSLPVPDLTKLGDGEREELNSWFDRLQNKTLQTLPQMADDPVRAQLDDAVAQVLGLDAEWIATVRREWVREPSVTNRRGN